jgi:hypothetical protein
VFVKVMSEKPRVNWDVSHVFHHYLECKIPKEVYMKKTVKEMLQMCRDVEILFQGKMTPQQFSEKYGI